jgi:hypothetical protein
MPPRSCAEVAVAAAEFEPAFDGGALPQAVTRAMEATVAVIAVSERIFTTNS